MQADPTDKALLAAWRAGDKASGAAFFDKHYAALTLFFRNKVSDADRDDIVQQTFMAASRASFDGRSSARTWLFAIGWRRLIDHYRASARRASREVGGVEQMSVADLGATPESRFAQSQERRLLLEGLRRLPLHQQVVLELHYWEDLSAREIGEVLEAPVGTVKTRLRDGRLRLTRILSEIATSPDVLQSTMDDLEGWARRARAAADTGP